MMEELKKILVTGHRDDAALAGILGALGGMGYSIVLEDYTPKSKPHKAHTPHQGKKECAKRLKKLGREKGDDTC